MPTLTTNTGAGHDARATVSGVDQYGSISLTTGSGCAPNSIVLSINFDKPWNAVFYRRLPYMIILTPANQNATSLMSTLEYKQQVFVPKSGVSNTGWVIMANSTSLNDGATYEWFYEVK